MNARERNVTLACWAVLLCASGFAYGAAMVKYRLWPIVLVEQMKHAVVALATTGRVYPRNLLVPARDVDKRVHVPQNARPQSGLRAIMGFDAAAETFAVWLLDASGREMHRWPVDYDAIVGQAGDQVIDKADDPHGLDVREDGSIVVNFDQATAIARLDPCGRPLWVTRGVFHHSLSRSEDGNYWTWMGAEHAYGTAQRLVKVDAETGRILESFDLVEDFIRRSAEASTTFSLPSDFDFQAFESERRFFPDIFHPNDVEELGVAMAEAFPFLQPGDLLISLRTLDLLAILRPADRSVVWAKNGPWRAQHDPDFNADGTISVYDNNPGVGVSSIMKVDPSTGRTRRLFEGGDLTFFSDSMGKHQMLPNGGALIAIPGEGRVVEVTRDGNVSFEFNNVVAPGWNGHVDNALWLPPDYFSEVPACNA